MELKEMIAELRDLADDNPNREGAAAAAEALALVAWADEVGATLYQWGSDWRCVLLDGSNHAQYYHDDTLLGAIRAAKEAYEQQG